MGEARRAEEARLFCAAMFAPDGDVQSALDALGGRYGALAGSYGPIAFSFSSYYEPEMGPDLQKLYVVFQQPFERDQVAAAKVFTNEIELRLAKDGRRRVNLDPGYLSRDKLVLATTKDFFHRIYLSRGIYAEVTLHYREGRYRHFSWTYADYKEPSFLGFLARMRAQLVGDLRRGAARR